MAQERTESRTRRAPSTAGRSARAGRSAEKVAAVLGVTGISAAVLGNTVRGTVVKKVEEKLQNLDIDESIDQVSDMALRAATSVRDYSRINPKLFFTGLTAIALGAGIVALAGREPRRD